MAPPHIDLGVMMARDGSKPPALCTKCGHSGKPGCKCAKSRGHGPKYYLSVSKPKQKPIMDYVPLDYQAQVNQYLENFRQVKVILEELCEINRELLKRREKL